MSRSSRLEIFEDLRGFGIALLACPGCQNSSYLRCKINHIFNTGLLYQEAANKLCSTALYNLLTSLTEISDLLQEQDCM